MEKTILDENFNQDRKANNLDKKTIAKINNIKISVNSKLRDVRTGRKTLAILGVFFIIASVVVVTRDQEIISINNPIESLIKAVIYIALAIGVRSNPKIFLISGLSFFILVQIYNATIDLSSIFDWIIIKIPIVYFLITGITGSMKLIEQSNELLLLGVPANELELIKKLEEIPRTE